MQYNLRTKRSSKRYREDDDDDDEYVAEEEDHSSFNVDWDDLDKAQEIKSKEELEGEEEKEKPVRTEEQPRISSLHQKKIKKRSLKKERDRSEEVLETPAKRARFESPTQTPSVDPPPPPLPSPPSILDKVIQVAPKLLEIARILDTQAAFSKQYKHHVSSLERDLYYYTLGAQHTMPSEWRLCSEFHDQRNSTEYDHFLALKTKYEPQQQESGRFETIPASILAPPAQSAVTRVLQTIHITSSAAAAAASPHHPPASSAATMMAAIARQRGLTKLTPPSTQQKVPPPPSPPQWNGNGIATLF